MERKKPPGTVEFIVSNPLLATPFYMSVVVCVILSLTDFSSAGLILLCLFFCFDVLEDPS